MAQGRYVTLVRKAKRADFKSHCTVADGQEHAKRGKLLNCLSGLVESWWFESLKVGMLKHAFVCDRAVADDQPVLAGLREALVRLEKRGTPTIFKFLVTNCALQR